jgi:hypothetical protein
MIGRWRPFLRDTRCLGAVDIVGAAGGGQW